MPAAGRGSGFCFLSLREAVVPRKQQTGSAPRPSTQSAPLVLRTVKHPETGPRAPPGGPQRRRGREAGCGAESIERVGAEARGGRSAARGARLRAGAQTPPPSPASARLPKTRGADKPGESKAGTSRPLDLRVPGRPRAPPSPTETDPGVGGGLGPLREATFNLNDDTTALSTSSLEGNVTFYFEIIANLQKKCKNCTNYSLYFTYTSSRFSSY